jgi:hypothetical protein
MKTVIIATLSLFAVSFTAAADNRCFNIQTQNWEECEGVPQRPIIADHSGNQDRCYDISKQDYVPCDFEVDQTKQGRPVRPAKPPVQEDECYDIGKQDWVKC